MKFFVIFIAAFAGLAAANGKCCAPGCGICSSEDCGSLGDNDCSNNSFYVTCCDDSKMAAASLKKAEQNIQQDWVANLEKHLNTVQALKQDGRGKKHAGILGLRCDEKKRGRLPTKYS
ncbi:hypothetical protein N0V93_002070 [Gnomoniopsis smithogilvyi]|uniref:Uncharacterized protein n=1 Tax=Gnomoniopsis smithogilvyi TaxID=1191159 RepID=A0A9W9D295_9PEZI|nr:hypothetical protein N0V93_002070 [Gnomoniopsis smithogilvyi]